MPKDLVSYRDTIVLGFSADGEYAWLKLKIYPYACFDKQDAAGLVEEWKLGVPGANLGIQEYKKTISLGVMLDAIDVVKFQRAVVRSVAVGHDRLRVHAPDEVCQLLSKGLAGIGIKCDFPASSKDVDMTYFNVRRVFWDAVGRHYAQLLYQKPSGDIKPLGEDGIASLENLNFTAYFPDPSLMQQEEDGAADAPTIPVSMFPGYGASGLTVAVRAKKKKTPSAEELFIEEIDKDIEEEKGERRASSLHAGIKRVSCYAFRGEGPYRGPEAVKASHGFLPGITRTDKWQKEKKRYDIAEAIDEAKDMEEYENVLKQHGVLHLGQYVRVQDFKVYVSFTKSRSVAKNFVFVSAAAALVRGYVYAARCWNGFDLAGMVTKHDFLAFNEQEVAIPGALWWEEVVGFRAVRVPVAGEKFFYGPVFLQNSLQKLDRRAFNELYSLLSGKQQSKPEKLVRLYPQTPWI